MNKETRHRRGDLVKVCMLGGAFERLALVVSATRRGTYVIDRCSGAFHRRSSAVEFVVLQRSPRRRVPLGSLVAAAASVGGCTGHWETTSLPEGYVITA